MKKVAVLGGGISGLTVAWKLAEMGIPVEVIEAQEYVGGLSATIYNDGHKMDFGPHSFFTEDQEIFETIKEMFGDDLLFGTRDVRLYMDGKYLRYPLNAEDILLKLGPMPSAKCFISFVVERLRKEQEYGPIGPNMEQWSTRNFGRALHKLFFKPYTEQFWDVNCRDLSPNCIPTYKQMSFMRTLKFLFTPRKLRDNLSVVDREKLPLYYPRNGFGTIGEKIAEKVTSLNGQINLGYRINEVRRLSHGGYVIKAQNRKNETLEFEIDFLVSTIPIPDFAKMITPEIPLQVREAAKKIKYLSLLALYLITDKPQLLDYMYEYSLEKPYNRITDVNNFTLVPIKDQKGNMLSIEQSCHFGDKRWNQSKEDLFKSFIFFIEKEGILKESDVKDIFLLKASHAYPMYLYDYKKSLDTFEQFIESNPNMRICGRTGSFKYMDIDQCMKLAFNLADEMGDTILNKKKSIKST